MFLEVRIKLAENGKQFEFVVNNRADGKNPHFFESAHKFTIKADDANAEETTIPANINKALDSFSNILTIYELATVASVCELMMDLDEKLVFAEQKIIYGNLCYGFGEATINGKANEVKLVTYVSSESYISVKLEILNSKFSVKIPRMNFANNKFALKSQLQISFANWSSKLGDNEPLGIIKLSKAKEKILESMDSDSVKACWALDTAETVTEADKPYQHLTYVKKNLEEPNPICSSDDVKYVTPKIEIDFVYMKTDSLAFAHLIVNSDIQTTELLLDLKNKSFNEKVPSELDEFNSKNSIEYSKEETVLSLSTIKPLLEEVLEVQCELDNEEAPKNLTCKKEDKKVLAVDEDNEDGNSNLVIRFEPPTDVQKSKSMTNAIILQKFNSFDQFKEIKKGLEAAKANIGL
jgi:hypothetical protein